MQAPTRTAFGGPALVRLLARMAESDVLQPASSLSDRLSQWLGWTDAIALSTALASDPAAASARIDLSGEEEACARARAALVRAFTLDERTDTAARDRRRTAAPAPADEPPVDYAVLRHRYVSLQQTMETDIAALRARLRAAVAARSADMARLAVVDSVMEQALAARERNQFAQVPVLLGRQFERLRRANADAPSPAAWLAPFRRDMQSVLLAELDVRFQPVEGLLAALRTR